MAYPATIDAPDTTMQGGSLLSTNDHATDHRLLGSAVINLETKLGVGSGSAAANQILVGQGAGTSSWGTVWNNGVMGTPLINGGTISGAAVSGTFNNPVLGTPTIQAWDGWIQEAGTWNNLGTDTHTGTFSIVTDVTGKYQNGMRMKFTSGGSTQYGMITNVGVFSGGSTIFTFYAGTAYALGGGSITSPFYSPNKTPFGFITNPTYWTEQYKSSSDFSLSPATGVWVNPGTATVVIPIGIWRAWYSVVLQANTTSAPNILATFSTGTATQSDTDFTTILSASAAAVLNFTASREKFISLASKTSYFLNAQYNGTASLLSFLGASYAPTIINVTSAYL